MYIKQIDKTTYRRDWKKEIAEIAYLVGIGAVVVIDIAIAVLIFKSF